MAKIVQFQVDPMDTLWYLTDEGEIWSRQIARDLDQVPDVQEAMCQCQRGEEGIC